MHSGGYSTWSVCLFVCPSVRLSLANLAVQGTGRPMTATNRIRVARSLILIGRFSCDCVREIWREKSQLSQSIAQAPRGRRTRVLPEHAHNRETPRSSIVVSDRREYAVFVCSS